MLGTADASDSRSEEARVSEDREVARGRFWSGSASKRELGFAASVEEQYCRRNKESLVYYLSWRVT